jgi:hypothetical protein
MPLNTISMGQTTQQKQTGSGQDWASGPLVGGDLQPVIIVACAAKGLGSQSLVPFGLHQVGARTSLVAGMLGSRWVPSLLHGGGGIHHPRHVRSVGESTCPKKASMLGSCAGEGGCSGGRQRLSIRVGRGSKLATQRARSSLFLCGGVSGGCPLNKGASSYSYPSGVGAFQNSNK